MGSAGAKSRPHKAAEQFENAMDTAEKQEEDGLADIENDKSQITACKDVGVDSGKDDGVDVDEIEDGDEDLEEEEEAEEEEVVEVEATDDEGAGDSDSAGARENDAGRGGDEEKDVEMRE